MQEFFTQAVSSKKHTAVLWAIVAFGVVLLLIAVNLMGSGAASSSVSSIATVHTATAELMSLSQVLPASGTLTEEASVDISLVEGVEISEWLVADGDTVTEGDVIARVDQVSVMSAIAEVQECIDTLDEALKDAADNSVSSTVTAGAAGRVMAIYAEAGDSVLDVMYAHGALALISLDGHLSVSFDVSGEFVGDLAAEDAVEVVLGDGTTLAGTVKSFIKGSCTVVVDETAADFGEEAFVYAVDGELLGEGILEIESPLKITGYTGTIKAVKTEEGKKISSGADLFTLSDTDDSSEADRLIALRSELTSELSELFSLYEQGYLTASASGIISGTGNKATAKTEAAADDAEETDAAKTDSPETGAVLGSSGQEAFRLASETSEEELPEDGSEVPQEDGSEVPQEDDSNPQSDDDTDIPSEDENISTKLEITATLTAEGISDVTQFALLISADPEFDSAETHSFDALGEVRLELTEGTWYVKQLTGSDAGISYDESVYILTVAKNEAGELSLHITKDGLSVSDIVFSNTVRTDAPADPADPVEPVDPDDPDESDEPTTPNEPDSQAEVPGGIPSDDISDGDISSLLDGITDTISITRDGSSGSSSLSGGSGGSAEALGDSALSNSSEEESPYTFAKNVLCTITPTEYVSFSISVDELDILSLAVGQEAEVTLDALPGQSFAGSVCSLDATGQNQGGSSKYTAEIQMDRTAAMLAGMNASAKIEISSTDDVLCIPVDALVEDGGSTYVYTTYNTSTNTLGGLTEVLCGRSDGEYVEILSGLDAGDTCYYALLDTLVL